MLSLTPAILLAITLVIIILIAPMKHKIYWIVILILCVIGFINNLDVMTW